MQNNADQHRGLLEIIKEKLGLRSNTKARNIIKSGRVKLDDKTVKIPSQTVSSEQKISIESPKQMQSTSTNNVHKGFTIIYEDDQYIAFVKPSGLLSVSTLKKKKAEKNFSDFLKKQFMNDRGPNAELYIINRLDRLTSGIVLFAKSPADEVAVRKKWDDSSKRYYAMVEGVPNDTDGEISSELKQNRIGRVYSVSKSQYSKLCITKYRILQKSKDVSLLKIEAIAERKNSIRAQLSEKNWPIIGDKDYKGNPSPIKRFGLHLFSLKFYHPIKKEFIEIKTPVPVSFKNYFKSIKKKPAN
jgi:RluA family pseudouridine synthase